MKSRVGLYQVFRRNRKYRTLEKGALRDHKFDSSNYAFSILLHKTITMVYFAHVHRLYRDHHNNVRGKFNPKPTNTLIPRAPVRRDPATNWIIQEATFLPDTIYKLEQIPWHLRPSVGKGMVFADNNQYLNGGAHAIMSTSGQPVALYEQYIITGLKCDERVHARNLNESSLSMPIGTTHMAMALPTYARSNRNGLVHDMVVDICKRDRTSRSDANETSSWILTKRRNAIWCHQNRLCFVHIFLILDTLYNCYQKGDFPTALVLKKCPNHSSFSLF